MESEVEGGVVPLHRVEQLLDGNVRVQLLPNLAVQGLLGRLSSLNLATGKLPSPGHVAVSSLRGEDTSLGVVYHRRHDLNVW